MEAKTAAPFLGLPRDHSGPRLSVVIPMFDEEGGAAALAAEVAGRLSGMDAEIVAVDDCSRDCTREELAKAQRTIPNLRVLTHSANAGQSRAIRTGVLAARAPVIATLDGDGQNDPDDIRTLFDLLTSAGAPPLLAMVAGERRARHDALGKKMASRIANAVRRRVLNDGAADTGCGLKVFWREAYLRLPYFDHQHRYLPALMRREGFEVAFRAVGHRPRSYGNSKYTNLGRLAAAFGDLSGVVWLKARARSPGAISELEPPADCDTMGTGPRAG